MLNILFQLGIMNTCALKPALEYRNATVDAISGDW